METKQLRKKEQVFTTVEQDGDFAGTKMGRLWVLRNGTSKMGWIGGFASLEECQVACARLSALDSDKAHEFVRRVWDDDEDFDDVLEELTALR